MVKIDEETIQQLTRLCRIDCTPEEKEKLLSDLQQILGYIEQLNEIDTKGIPPCNYVLEEYGNGDSAATSELDVGMREDKVGTVLLDRKTFLDNSPSHIAGMVRVPLIFK